MKWQITTQQKVGLRREMEMSKQTEDVKRLKNDSNLHTLRNIACLTFKHNVCNHSFHAA